MKRLILPALVAWVLMPGTGLAQQLAGTVSGVVRDAQGGVLPGASVTLTGTALIGGARTDVASEAGAFRFADLPPGMYEVTVELAGFTTTKQEGIRVQVAQNTRVDVQLGLGTVSETVTVSGDSPIVDVSTNTTPTNIDKELFDAIPTSRNPWVLAALAPGVVAGRLDVGGTEAMQQYSLEVGRQSEDAYVRSQKSKVKGQIMSQAEFDF